MESPATAPSHPGDDIIPDAAMVYDRKRLINAPPSDVFPWLVQLGAGRGGWPLKSSWERFLPKSCRAARHLNPAWQKLEPGDRVEDHKVGMGEGEFFIVRSIDPPESLVYVSERLGTVFTWTLMCHRRGVDRGVTEVHLRLRGRMLSTGWRRSLPVWGGDWMDWIFTEPMLSGLAERCCQS